VPHVIDKKAAQAIKILQAAGCKVQVQSVPHPTLDRVIDESPQGGSPAPYGSTVVITIV
jgi:beta-lactam-binding protein with PASTA domain